MATSLVRKRATGKPPDVHLEPAFTAFRRRCRRTPPRPLGVDRTKRHAGSLDAWRSEVAAPPWRRQVDRLADTSLHYCATFPFCCLPTRPRTRADARLRLQAHVCALLVRMCVRGRARDPSRFQVTHLAAARAGHASTSDLRWSGPFWSVVTWKNQDTASRPKCVTHWRR